MTDPDTDRDAQHVLWLIAMNGWTVHVDGTCLHATRGGEEQAATADTLYLAACELAERCGVDLRDG